MGDDTATLISSASDIASVLLSLAAIIIAIRTEARASKRFIADMEASERIAVAQLRPLLAIFVSEFVDHKAITLENHGAGAAVITDVSFSKNNKKVKNVALLFDLQVQVEWDDYWTFRQFGGLQPGQEITLVKLTQESLIMQGHSPPGALQVLEEWQQQIHGIQFHIEYEDLLGNKQDDYERIL